ncbi:eukaryotic peptide chain release factor GTP-binding subunit [Thecamonas trahens ATCC 50062]|uniref:Eukaryotic peptide chain release factor GTP-binding subunit n=1 Tax=Thecamonas trahens ATCC 50062 TaxID=461836 RepID=A0A0L0DFE1_THETB|nr:eukaryotic peptide chain release factor GTP-binding subunit [Thecamonas trahens ATCC 50062]KNC50033.1 eukaryotic peptide chain release factor GTP-binding subunit [Thecamonas trahens ATCC 50062]|eukprot:XP_013757200.1 eukaryotic peptide chain release factor GTP-binding subunit [Thecamonas trahens ATCC 50062]
MSAEEQGRISVCVIGQVDHGKSSLCGRLLYEAKALDGRMLDRLEREASASGAGTSWKWAFAMDSTEFERERGKTCEIGRAALVTPGTARKVALLDAPGHDAFVPHMIGGAVQADAGLLVVSARATEFEEGFDARGQTKEHCVLARAAGLKHIIVAVNKMDDPSVAWGEARYAHIATTLTHFLTTSLGFEPEAVTCVPVSAWTGEHVTDERRGDAAWTADIPSLMAALEALPARQTAAEAALPLRLPVSDWFTDPFTGLNIMGVIALGTINAGDRLRLEPSGATLDVVSMTTPQPGGQIEVAAAGPGTPVTLTVRGIDEVSLSLGQVLIDDIDGHPTLPTTKVMVRLLFLDSAPGPVMAGYDAVAHIHAAEVDVLVEGLRRPRAKAKSRSKHKPLVARPGDHLDAPPSATA